MAMIGSQFLSFSLIVPLFFCNARFLSAMDRLAKEKDKYMQHCLDAFVYAVVSTLPGLLETITVDIQQLMGGRRQGLIPGFGSRSSPKNSIHFFPVVLHLLGSSSFRNSVITPQVLLLVANLLKLTESPFQVYNGKNVAVIFLNINFFPFMLPTITLFEHAVIRKTMKKPCII